MNIFSFKNSIFYNVDGKRNPVYMPRYPSVPKSSRSNYPRQRKRSWRRGSIRLPSFFRSRKKVIAPQFIENPAEDDSPESTIFSSSSSVYTSNSSYESYSDSNIDANINSDSDSLSSLSLHESQPFHTLPLNDEPYYVQALNACIAAQPGTLSGFYHTGNDNIHANNMCGNSMWGNSMWGDNMHGNNKRGNSRRGNSMYGNSVCGNSMWGDNMHGDAGEVDRYKAHRHRCASIRGSFRRGEGEQGIAYSSSYGQGPMGVDESVHGESAFGAPGSFRADDLLPHEWEVYERNNANHWTLPLLRNPNRDVTWNKKRNTTPDCFNHESGNNIRDANGMKNYKPSEENQCLFFKDRNGTHSRRVDSVVGPGDDEMEQLGSACLPVIPCQPTQTSTFDGRDKHMNYFDDENTVRFTQQYDLNGYFQATDPHIPSGNNPEAPKEKWFMYVKKDMKRVDSPEWGVCD